MRVLTILVRFGVERFPHAEQQIDEIFRRQMPAIERTVVIVDNALPGGYVEGNGRRAVIGGKNEHREFSGFDRGIDHVGSQIWNFDLVHFSTDAFNSLYVDYLTRFRTSLLQITAKKVVCVGHIDCYNQPVEILGFQTQHWIRTCFFFLSPTDVKLLGSFVTVHDRRRFFSGSPQDPFRSDAPLSEAYRKYIIDWLTGGTLGQGAVWHSSFRLTDETISLFEAKALSIMNEHLLAVRLRAMGCRLVDVVWLSTVPGLKRASSATWSTPWQEQLAYRNREKATVGG